MLGDAGYFEAHDVHPLLAVDPALEDYFHAHASEVGATAAMGGELQDLGDYAPQMNVWEAPEDLAAGCAHTFHNDQNLNLQTFNASEYGNPPHPPPDLVTLLHLPPASCKRYGRLDIFEEPTLQLSFPPPPPVFRELFHSQPPPHGYEPAASRGGSFFGGTEEREMIELQEQENSVLDFRRKAGRGEARGANHYATERQRRGKMNEKYIALKSLVPNPSKNDKASVLSDAIDYIKELLRTVEELKILVEKKRSKRPLKTAHETAAVDDMESSVLKPSEKSGSLRTSWLLRRSKETAVDVRIIDDEVNIKLTRRKKVNCLLVVARVLHELRLNLLQVAGGSIGDHYIFMFNTKINEGSSVYASAIANKLIEALDR